MQIVRLLRAYTRFCSHASCTQPRNSTNSFSKSANLTCRCKIFGWCCGLGHLALRRHATWSGLLEQFSQTMSCCWNAYIGTRATCLVELPSLCLRIHALTWKLFLFILIELVKATTSKLVPLAGCSSVVHSYPWGMSAKFVPTPCPGIVFDKCALKASLSK